LIQRSTSRRTIAALTAACATVLGGLTAQPAHAVVSADVQIFDLSAPDTVMQGEILPVQFGLYNNGPAAASPMTVDLGLPAGGSVVSTQSSGATCTGSQCTASSFPAGSYVQVKAEVILPTAGDQEITLTVADSGNWTDPDTGNNSWSTYVLVEAAADGVAAHYSGLQVQVENDFYDFPEQVAVVTGSLLQDADNAGVVGERVDLLERPEGDTGAYTFVDYTTTVADGVFYLSDFSAAPRTEYVVRHVATPATDATTSEPVSHAQIAATASLRGPTATVTRGRSFTVTSTVKVGGELMTGLPVRLLQKLNGADSYIPVATVNTTYEGIAAFTRTAVRNGSFRIDVPETVQTSRTLGPPLFVGVRPKLVQSLSPVMIPRNGTSRLSFALPGLAGDSVAVQRSTSSGWKTVATRTLDPAAAASYALRPASLGDVKLRVYRSGGSGSDYMPLAGTAVTLAVVKFGPGTRSQHKFIGVVDGKPVRWDPCKPIRYRVNWKQAPAGAKQALAESLRRITQINGLRFKYLGKTSYWPSMTFSGQPAPVVIAWTDRSPDDTSRKWTRDDEAGLTSTPYLIGTGFKTQFIEGFVALNSTQNRTFKPGFGAGKTQGALLLHELGHLVGLGHVKSTDEMLYPYFTAERKAAIYGAGDYAGLKKLGRSAGCLS
jgi:hypothetical protein